MKVGEKIYKKAPAIRRERKKRDIAGARRLKSYIYDVTYTFLPQLYIRSR
jgi:hypothetical protein